MSNLLRHRKVHLGIKPYECHKCQKKFSSVSNLNQHLMIHDRRSARCKFNCFVEGCDQSYFYICTLKNHIVKFHHDLFSKIENENKNSSFIDIYKKLIAKRNGTAAETQELLLAEQLESAENPTDLEKKEEKFRSKNLFRIMRRHHEPTKELEKPLLIIQNQFEEKRKEDKPKPEENAEMLEQREILSPIINSGSNNYLQNLMKKFSTLQGTLLEIEIVNLTFNFLFYNYTISSEVNKIIELTKLHTAYNYNMIIKNYNQNQAIISILYKELSCRLLRGQPQSPVTNKLIVVNKFPKN